MGNARHIDDRPQNEVQVQPDKLEGVASFCYLGDMGGEGLRKTAMSESSQQLTLKKCCIRWHFIWVCTVCLIDKTIFRGRIYHFIEILTHTSLKYKMDNSKLIVSVCMGQSIRTKWVKFDIWVPIFFFFFYFSTKTYFVSAQKNHLNETVLLSTQNIC